MIGEQAINDVIIDSSAVGRKMRVRIIMPPGFAPDGMSRIPVLYFLHPWGLSPGYITDKLNIHRHLWDGVNDGSLPPMVIVLPTGHRSFFINADDPPGHDWSSIITSGDDRFFDDALNQYGNYGDYLLDEVIPYVESHYPVCADRAGRAIGGISMGGAGAAIHAFRHPERFCALGMHSPALLTESMADQHIPWIFGLTPDSFSTRSPIALAQRLNSDSGLRIYLDAGTNDLLREQVESFHAVLSARGITHEYSMPVGGHDKTYWEPRMREYLAFYAREW